MNMTDLLACKTAFVTGAGQGNGRAIAIGLARAGAHVVVTDMNAASVDETARLIRAEGGSASSHALNVTDAQQCQELARHALDGRGELDILVNNAGILIRGDIDSPNAVETLRRVMQVNLEGTFNVTHAWLASLRKACGAIVNIASVASYVGWADTPSYAPSKGAVKQLTQSLAMDLGKDGVRVNAIAPGVIATPMTTSTRDDPEKLERFLQRIPLGRVGNPEELVGTVLFLASSMSSYVTGITLPVDGGFLAA